MPDNDFDYYETKIGTQGSITHKTLCWVNRWNICHNYIAVSYVSVTLNVRIISSIK